MIYQYKQNHFIKVVFMHPNLYDKYIKNFNLNLLDCTVIGKGHNGVVFMLPEGKVLKVCFKAKNCKKEYFILDKVHENKYFPKVYGMSGNYMIRDYVEGIFLHDYIRYEGLNHKLALEIIELLEEFQRLHFSKLDIRCKDIIIKPNGTLMVIDPKKFYSKKRSYPRHLEKGLARLGVLDFFLSVVKQERPKLYNYWAKARTNDN
jgi:RIO-like serine/threonine protein kinase